MVSFVHLCRTSINIIPFGTFDFVGQQEYYGRKPAFRASHASGFVLNAMQINWMGVTCSLQRLFVTKIYKCIAIYFISKIKIKSITNDFFNHNIDLDLPNDYLCWRIIS